MNEGHFDLSGVLANVSALLSTWGLQVLGAIVLLIIGLMVAKIARASVRRSLERTTLDKTLIPFLAGMVYYLLVTFVVLAVLRLFGIETTSLVAVLGAAGLAVGLAVQGTLANFASGVMLLIFRPFKVGDYIDAGGTAGTVEDIGLFATKLNSPDNVKIIAANSSIYSSTIKNYSTNDTRRNDLVIGVSYDDDLGTATATIKRALEQDARVLKDPAPTVAVSELGDSSVNIVVRPWCKKEDYWALRFDLTRKLKEDLEAAGCSIPFPQRDVHLHQVGSAG